MRWVRCSEWVRSRRTLGHARKGIVRNILGFLKESLSRITICQALMYISPSVLLLNTRQDRAA